MTHSVVVVDTGLGNLNSVANMLSRVGVQPVLSFDHGVISAAEKLVIPGVGNFAAGMQALRDRGLVDILTQRVIGDKVPALGICLGMQLLFEGSEEGGAAGLGWIRGCVVRLRPPEGERPLAVPHMGWNSVSPVSPSPLFAGQAKEPRYYFVHSYYAECADDATVLATTDYGIRFASAVRQDTLFGVQFHPEKSHRFGVALLRNFATL